MKYLQYNILLLTTIALQLNLNSTPLNSLFNKLIKSSKKHNISQEINPPEYNSLDTPNKSTKEKEKSSALDIDIAEWLIECRHIHPLKRAIVCNNLDMLKLLTKKYNFKAYGDSLLCWAIEAGHLAILEWLLKNGVNANTKLCGTRPLHYAIEHCQEISIIECLIKNGANINETYALSTPLSCAIKNQRKDVVELLLKYKAQYQLE